MANQLQAPPPNSWGVFTQSGSPAFDVDSCQSVKFNNQVKVSNFPVEQGGFATYNKVNSPYGFKIRLAVGGPIARRTAFLDALEAMLDTTTLYNVVTPEKTYLNATLKDYDYSREASKGQTLLVVECAFEEVRQVVPQYTTVGLPASKVKNPGASSKTNTGKQQVQTPPTPPSLSSLTIDQIISRAKSDAGVN